MSLGGVIAIAAAAYIVYISKRELNKIIKANMEASSEHINEVVSQPESNEDEVHDDRLHESRELDPNQESNYPDSQAPMVSSGDPSRSDYSSIIN